MAHLRRIGRTNKACKAMQLSKYCLLQSCIARGSCTPCTTLQLAGTRLRCAA